MKFNILNISKKNKSLNKKRKGQKKRKKKGNKQTKKNKVKGRKLDYYKVGRLSYEGMKAKNELAQIRSKDTLPLRRDKINQQAALRKMQNINKITNISNKKGKELNYPQHFKKIKTVNTLIHVSNKNVDNTAEIKSNINNNLNRSNSINEILSKSEDILKSIEEEGLLN